MPRATIEILEFEIDIYFVVFCIVCCVLSVIAQKFIDRYEKERVDLQEDFGSVDMGVESFSEKNKSSYGKNIAFVARILIIVALLLGKYLLFDGQNLPHKPDMYNVSSVVVEYQNSPGEAEEYDDELTVKAAVAILNDLDYARLEKAPGGEPYVKVTYVTKDNVKVVVEANEKTVWWRGKAYAVKDRGKFLESCRFLFHSESDNE